MFASRTNWCLTPNRLSQEVENRRRQGLPLLDLTESNPTRCAFAYNTEEILNALADPRSLIYQPEPRGPLLAREAVAGYYAERGGKIGPEQIFLTTSTSEAYSYVFRLLANPGDSVLIPRPSYPLFDFLARLNDVELVRYPLVYENGWRIDLEALAGAVCSNTRAILAVHPNNPTGSFVREVEREFLVRLCRDYDIALVADEVFADYALPAQSVHQAGARVVSLASTDQALTFTMSGLSKISGLPQMKLAWIIVNGPRDVLEGALARLEIIADTYLSVSAPLAHALPELLRVRRTLQPQIQERILTNLRCLDQMLASHSTVMRLALEGGWYAILRLPDVRHAAGELRSDEDWAVELVRSEGVLVHPGHFYDFTCEGHLVVSLLPTPDVFQEGTRRVLVRLDS